MRGWFDAFRTDGGPTLYSYSNRTPVTGDVPTITLYVLFFTLFIAFVIIFPGVRKEVRTGNQTMLCIVHNVVCVIRLLHIQSYPCLQWGSSFSFKSFTIIFFQFAVRKLA
jgi:hypothetical protein